MKIDEAAEQLAQSFAKRVAEVALEVADGKGGSVTLTFATDEAAIRRGRIAFLNEVDPTDQGSEACVYFALAHGLGDGAALRRAKTAISDPRAKGREVEILDALIAGKTIEDALQLKPTKETKSPSDVVIPFRRK